MKKRILSFLLLFAMLLSMVPVAAQESGVAQEGGESSRSETYTDAETYYDLYKKEGLVVFFDALSADSGTVDFENGKWYGKVLNAQTGKLVVDQSKFATLVGGTYNETDNPTGWKTDGGIGLGYDDPYFDAPSNALTFDPLLLSYSFGDRIKRFDNWTIESVMKVNIRKMPQSKELFTKDSVDFPLIEAAIAGGKEYTAVGSTKWQNSTSVLAVVVLRGPEETKQEVTFISNLHPDGTKVNVTFDANGMATVSHYYNAETLTVRTSASVTVESISLPKSVDKESAAVKDAFYFGSVSGYHFTNANTLIGSGDGFGDVRWSVSNTPGTYNSPAVIIANVLNTSIWTNSKSFNNVDGMLSPMQVYKTTVSAGQLSYTIEHGGITCKGETPDRFEDKALQILKGDQGFVYAFRIYSNNLTAEEVTRHNSLDLLIRKGVDIAKFNKMHDALKDDFLLHTASNFKESITKEEIETVIADTIAFDALMPQAKTLSKYDQLYVGADGEETANGGHLTALFTAYGSDVSVSLATGVWVNKVGANNATFGNKEYWSRTDTGIGFDVFVGMVDENGVYTEESPYNNYPFRPSTTNYAEAKTRLQFGLDLLPKEDFTVEYVAEYKHIQVADVNGNSVGDYFDVTGASNTPSGQHYTTPVDYIGFLTNWSTHRDGKWDNIGTVGSGMFFLGDGASWFGKLWYTQGSSTGMSENYTNWKQYGRPLTYAFTRDEETTINSDTTRTVTAHYEVLSDLSRFGYADATTDSDVGGQKYHDYDDTGDFYLSSALPTTFHAVRIYDAVLTREEMLQNRFADMAGFAGADLTLYNSLSPANKALVHAFMAENEFIDYADDFDYFLHEYISALENHSDEAGALYVQDGLRVLLTAYDGFNTGLAVAATGDSISWMNGARKGEVATLKGRGWELRESGGFYIQKNYEEYTQDKTFGLYLTPEMLPEQNFTVELITNPTGITEYDADGNLMRSVDDFSQHGTNHEHGFSIGPLRCLLFPMGRGNGIGGMEKRWVYQFGNRCFYGGFARNEKFLERQWQTVDLHQIVNYSITYAVNDYTGNGVYTFYNDFTQMSSFAILKNDIIDNARANYMFQMMVGMPGGIFAVRVYDRALSELERIQNQVADIIYYYDIDVGILPRLLALYGNDSAKIFQGLSDFNFAMTKEEAQELFDARLSALWISYEDVAIRKDTEENALRFYFNFDESSAIFMIGKGFTVEVGAIVNLGQNAAPSLDGNNYDYKIVAYDTIAGKNTPFFIDEDTFAVTVLSDQLNAKIMNEHIDVRGYVRMISDTGEEITLYAAPLKDDYMAESFFTVYNYMQSCEAVAGYEDLQIHLTDAVEDAYAKEYVYLDADAADGGDGSKAAPFNDYETAFLAAKEKLKYVNKPTYLYLRADDGVYEVNNLLTLDDSENPYRYCRFIITARKKNKSTVTSTRILDNSGFIEADENIYTYQFEKDANGEYPFFRYLFVNGEMATIARNSAGSINEYDETRYRTEFWRYDDGAYIMAKRLWQTKKLTSDYNYYPADRSLLRTRFAYYRDSFLAYDEVRALSAQGNLTLETPSANSNATSAYLAFFEQYRMKQVAQNELLSIFENDFGKNIEEAKAGFPLCRTKLEDPGDAYLAYFRQMRDVLSERLTQNGIFNIALTNYDPAIAEVILTPFSSGAFDVATEMFEEGSLTYTSEIPYVGERALIQGEQFIYYRDAYLALRDVEALAEAGTLTLASVGASEGSAQYKALFDSYKNRGFAFMELLSQAEALRAKANGALTWQSEFSALSTANTAAGAAYAEAYTELKHDIVLSDYVLLEEFELTVNEKDAVYEGNLPFFDPREEGKLYFDIDMVGDLSRAIADGLVRLENDAVTLRADAAATYAAAYETLVAKEASHAELLLQQAAAQAAFDATKPTDTSARMVAKKKLANANLAVETSARELMYLRRDVNTARDTYKADLALADQYLDTEYRDRYKIQEAGLELQMSVEWCFDILHMAGVDYTDKIEKDGKTYVALYVNMDEYEKFQFGTTETYVYQRISTIMNSDAYLTKNNEFYYDSVNGKLYYYSDEGIDDLQMEYPTADNLFYFTDVDRVTVSNLQFTGFDDSLVSKIGIQLGQAGGMIHKNSLGFNDHFPAAAPIYIYDSKDIIITDCTFHDLGAMAINTRGRLYNVTVTNNTFLNIGSSAVRIGGINADYPRWSASQGAVDTLIENNYLENIACRIYNNPAIVVQSSLGTTISHNTMRKLGYMGVQIGWHWQEVYFNYHPTDHTLVYTKHATISYNFVESFMMEQADGGALYTVGGNFARDDASGYHNWMHDNYVVATNVSGDGEQHFFAGYYYDGSSTHWESYNNVMVAHSYGAEKYEELDDAEYAEIGCPLPKEEYLRRLRNRNSLCAYFFAQYIIGATAHHVGFHDNYFINSRANPNNPDAQHYEAYRDYVNEANNVTEERTTYVQNPANMPMEAEEIAYNAGCDWYTGDPTLLYDNNY